MPREASEFFYRQGKSKKDSELHKPILSSGKHDLARSAAAGVLHETGLPEDFTAPLIDKAKLDAIRGKR